jgi:CDP-paratose 2-epimerase
MKTAIVSGSAGLIGSEASKFLHAKGLQIVGIDNNYRSVFFGNSASTLWNRQRLENELAGYIHFDEDIRDAKAMDKIFKNFGKDISLVIHAAAQPSHDWAATDPMTDFSINANGTLNLLEMSRKYCPKTVFIFLSTNKVYGDKPNYLPLQELETRWEIDPDHPYFEHGIDEEFGIDQTKHSLFGASKVAADVLVQEYGRYFDMKTACFRGGCLTGPAHSGTELHGFLAYLMKCAIDEIPYTIFGYMGKQVRDNIHSYDLVNMLWHFYQKPRIAEVYNVGGSRHSHCSVLEAIHLCEEISGRKINYTYHENNRIGDHIWWVSDIRKFQSHYPDWQYKYNLENILVDIFNGLTN